MNKTSPNTFEHQVLQIAALGTWQIVTSKPMLRPLVPVQDRRWAEKTGVFVTLKLAGQVRGSVGLLESSTTLQESLFDAGQSAATHDHRYNPVQEDELEALGIEVTLIDKVTRVSTAEQVVIGKTGLIVSQAEKRAVLLPHVAFEQGWTSEQFLEATCEKAGLPHSAWKDPNTLVEGFSCVILEAPSLYELIHEFVSLSLAVH